MQALWDRRPLPFVIAGCDLTQMFKCQFGFEDSRGTIQSHAHTAQVAQWHRIHNAFTWKTVQYHAHTVKANEAVS